MSLEFCQRARDEVRYDVLEGEFYDTGIVLLCSARPEPGLPFCRSCLPRSDNRNGPYIVRWGFCLELRAEFPIFADALAHYASLRQDEAILHWGGPELVGARFDLEDDGLSDEERELLGMLP